MKKYLLASVLALSCMQASAGVVDFNGHENTIYGDEDTSNGIASVTVGGYVFSNADDHLHLADLAEFGDPSNGTSSLLSDRGAMLTMTKAGGGHFDLGSLESYGYFSDKLTVTGYFAGGGSISASFAIRTDGLSLLSLAGFRELNRVTFSGSPETITAPAGFGIDNLVVQDAGATVPVPEPFTLGLAGIALAGMALGRRRTPAA